MGYVKVIKSSPYYSRYQVRQDGVLGGGRGRRARRRRGKGGRQSTRRRWAAAGGRPARRGSPAHARRPRPPGMPGGDGRAWLPAGRVAPAKTVRAAAADGVLWGQARPPPRPRARDAPLVSTKDGGARALVVTPVPWKGPNVGLGPSILAVGWRFARGRAPPSRRQARRPPPIAGGRGAAAGGASRLLFPTSRAHTPPPHRPSLPLTGQVPAPPRGQDRLPGPPPADDAGQEQVS